MDRQIGKAAAATRAFLGRDCPQTEAMVLRIAKTARDAERLAVRSPKPAEVRAKLKKAEKLALDLARLLSEEPLKALNGGNGFHLAARKQLEGTNPPHATATPASLKAMAAGAAHISARLPGGRGSARVSDVLGNARGHLICAVGAAKLFQREAGTKPGVANERALQLAYDIWEIAGGKPSPKAISGETDSLAAWQRHMRAALCGRDDANRATVVQARRLVSYAVRAGAFSYIIRAKPLQRRT